jgi:hypothetical protein
MFGPVYHGTTDQNKEKIDKEGFKIFVGSERQENIRHGYQVGHDVNGIPLPIHHLGYGIYFTTVKDIAKQFNERSLRKLKTYYMDSDKYETINFSSPNTMMKWWISNGYDPQVAKQDRVKATEMLTNNLKNKYDFIWFKGKTIKRVLDGDQICVYNLDIIREIDDSLSKPGDVGSICYRKVDNMKGKILNIRMPPNITTPEKLDTSIDYRKERVAEYKTQLESGKGFNESPLTDRDIKLITSLLKQAEIELQEYLLIKQENLPITKWLSVKWDKGGTDLNVPDSAIKFEK